MENVCITNFQAWKARFQWLAKQNSQYRKTLLAWEEEETEDSGIRESPGTIH